MCFVREDINFLVEQLEEDGVQFEGQIILVTGGAGFLGSWICDSLVRLGGKIICIDNFYSGKRENIEHLESLETFKCIEHDISKPIFFDVQIDIVLHFASRASPLEFSRFPIQILKANTLGTWVALGIAKKHGARLVLASSSEVYGDPDPNFIPTPETYYGNVNSVGVRSCYDEAKRAAEAYVTTYRVQHGLDTRIARIHNTFGPRMRSGDIYGRVVTRFIDQALRGVPLTVFGNGHQTRSFSYVTDTVRCILKIAYLPELFGEVINVGNDVETRIIDLAETILELTGSKSEIEFHPLPPDDPKRRCPNISKANEFLGWEPKIRLEEGLQRTITWFQSRTIEVRSRHSRCRF